MTRTRVRAVLLVLIVLVAFTGCEQIWDIVGGIFGGGGTDQADFQVTGVSIEADRIVVTIANNGDLGESGVLVVIHLSDNTVFDFLDPEVASATTNLPALQSSVIYFYYDSIDVTGIPDGNYYVVARVDPNGTVPEASEFNNELVSFDTYAVTGGGGGETGDSYEPDNTPFEASAILVNSGPQQHSIDPAGDQDWFYFTAFGGETYQIETLTATGGTVGVGADTIIELYNASSTTTALDSDDDGGDGVLSLLQYEVPAGAGGTYYIRVTDFLASDIGDYDISVVTVDTTGTIDVTVE